MALVGVDPKQVDFVKKIPEKIQGAQALINGDLNEFLKRNTFGSVSIDALRQMASQGNSVEVVKQIALTGMAVADVDENLQNFKKKLPKEIQNMERFLTQGLDQLFNGNMPDSIDQLLRVFNEKSLFNGKEKEIFQLVRRQLPLVEDMFNDDGKAIVSNAVHSLNTQVGNLPIRDLLNVALPMAVERVANREGEAIHELYVSTINQLKSMNSSFSEQTVQVIQQILESSEKWHTFEKKKHQLNDDICRILRPAIEREKRFREVCNSLATSEVTLQECRQALNTTFKATQRQATHVKEAIERSYTHGNFLLKQAIYEFIDEISHLKDQTRSPEMVNLLKEHLEETVIRPFTENMYEREMDLNDAALVDKFANAFTFLQNQQRRA